MDESVHSIKIISETDDRQYTKLHKKLGHHKNPLEIEAKKQANMYTVELADLLKASGLLVKK